MLQFGGIQPVDPSIVVVTTAISFCQWIGYSGHNFADISEINYGDGTFFFIICKTFHSVNLLFNLSILVIDNFALH